MWDFTSLLRKGSLGLFFKGEWRAMNNLEDWEEKSERAEISGKVGKGSLSSPFP